MFIGITDQRILQLNFKGLYLFFYSNVEPLKNYFPVTLHCSLAIAIFDENPGRVACVAAGRVT